MKRIVSIFILMAFLLSIASMTGCANTVSNDSQTLEIYIGNFGYGYSWLDDEIDLFKEQSWVKEKYPELNIPTPQHNSENNFAGQRIITGESNTIDLFFTTGSAASYFSRTDSSGNSYFEDLRSLYFDREIPGEKGKTIASKLKPEILDMQEIQNLDKTKSYYGLPWVDGYMGLLYNKTLLKQYLGENYVLPRTTNELLALAEDLSEKKTQTGKSVVPFISASRASYWTQIFVTWWAQYEGTDSYDNYWNGLSDLGEYDGSIFAQDGRLEALEVVESLIGRQHGFMHSDVSNLSFTAAQSKFLLGEGIMMANGDWFENEMRETQTENPYNYEITYMRMPVISSIIKQCKSVKDDKALAFVVNQIDQNVAYENAKVAYAANWNKFTDASNKELAEGDYNRISSARKLMYKIDGHEAYIPAYATAKELAKDFLLFLATDTAIESFIDTTNGCGSPYLYDLATKNPEMYDSLPSIHKDRMKIATEGVRIPSVNSYALSYLGGLQILARTTNLEIVFTAQNSDDRKTPQRVWQDDIDYYTANQYANWNSLLMRAGLK